MLKIQTNVRLADYATMRLGGTPRALVAVDSRQELIEAVEWAEEQNLPILVLGGGSNVIFRDGYDGLVILNRLPGFHIVADDSNGTTIQVGAGENWDSVVARTVSMGLSGIEKLSKIPGTAGATPVQNVGAYGAEIADVFIELEAYDLTAKSFVTLDKAACRFSYRSSIFKSLADRRYVITSLTLRLSKQAAQPPFYESLQAYLDEHGVRDYTPQNIRDAVTAIRADKLPDPTIIANTGSFFKNPIIPAAQFEQLAKAHPKMPHWRQPDGQIKIPAGWLIEQAGLKGYSSHGMKTHDFNALVFVNVNASNYADLAAFQQEIVEGVRRKFNISLEQEPELI